MLFLFGFHFIKIFYRIILKEVFVCVKIAVDNFFFCRTEFLMNGYRQMNLLFIFLLPLKRHYFDIIGNVFKIFYDIIKISLQVK